MEYFGSLPETPRDECLRIVRSCRAYVGIVAMRYGFIDPQSGKSLTHLEYEEAQRTRLPSLIYLIDEERQPVLPKHIDFGEAADKLKRFKQDLRGRHVVSQFTTPEDLALRVSQDLPALAQRTGLEVRRGELAKVVESLPRVDWLTDERFDFLKKLLGDLAQQIGPDELLREALEFMLAGDRLAAAFLVARRSNHGLRMSTDLLMSVEETILKALGKDPRSWRTTEWSDVDRAED